MSARRRSKATPKRVRGKQDAAGLDAICSPRKKHMHARSPAAARSPAGAAATVHSPAAAARSPAAAAAEACSSPASPFPPSPGMRKFGTDRTRFLAAVAQAKLAHVALGNGRGPSLRGSSLGDASMPLGVAHNARSRVPAASPLSSLSAPAASQAAAHATLLSLARDPEIGRVGNDENAEDDDDSASTKEGDSEVDDEEENSSKEGTTSEDDGGDEFNIISGTTTALSSMTPPTSGHRQRTIATGRGVGASAPKGLHPLLDAENSAKPEATNNRHAAQRGRKRCSGGCQGNKNAAAAKKKKPSGSRALKIINHPKASVEAGESASHGHDRTGTGSPMPWSNLDFSRWTQDLDDTLRQAVKLAPLGEWAEVRAHGIKAEQQNQRRNKQEHQTCSQQTASIATASAGSATMTTQSPQKQTTSSSSAAPALSSRTRLADQGVDPGPAPRFADFTVLEIEQRWKTICPPIKGPWQPREDALLKRYVAAYGTERWSVISQHIPGRRGKQCRERWKNHLDPRLVKSAWTVEDDSALLAAQRRMGNRWTEIGKLLGGRGENSVKNRFHSLAARISPCPRGRPASNASGSGACAKTSIAIERLSNKAAGADNNELHAAAQLRSLSASVSSSGRNNSLSLSPSLYRASRKQAGSCPPRHRQQRQRAASPLLLRQQMAKLPGGARYGGMPGGCRQVSRRHSFTGSSARSEAFASRSRRPSNSQLMSMTRAFLGVEISRIRAQSPPVQVKASRLQAAAAAQPRQQQLQQQQRSKETTPRLISPTLRASGGQVCANARAAFAAVASAGAGVDAAAASDVIPAAGHRSGGMLERIIDHFVDDLGADKVRSTKKVSSPVPISATHRLHSAFSSNQTVSSSGREIQLLTSNFLDKEASGRSAGVAGFHSGDSDTCVQLRAMVRSKDKEIRRLRQRIRSMSSSGSSASDNEPCDDRRPAWSDREVASMPVAANPELEAATAVLSLSRT